MRQHKRLADIARQTFFNYFGVKEDVVHAWVSHRRDEIGASLMQAAGEDTVNRLRHGLLTVAALYDADADTSRPMVRHWIRRGGPLLPDAYATANLLRVVLEDGQNAGDIPDDVDAASPCLALSGRLCSSR